MPVSPPQSAIPPAFRSFPSFPRGAWLLVIVTWLATQPLPALAQRTGGSFGGGNFASEEESPRIRRQSMREEDSHSERTERKAIVFSTPSSFSAEKQRKDSPPLSLGSFCCILSVLVVFIVIVVIASRQERAKRSGEVSLGPYAMHVSALSLALDWRARKPIQEHLEQIAQRADTASPHGLAQALSEVVLALRRYEMSWLYVGYRNEGNHPPREAEQAFRRLVQDFRARYQHEVIRGKGRVAGPEIRPHASEGEGVVVVTLVLATRRVLRGFPLPPHDPSHKTGISAELVREALNDRGALSARDMVAMEVIWSPAADNDRMSTAELESIYPELRLIDPNSIAGRIFCAYCSGPFAAELLNCPHCGAPASESRGRRTPWG